MGSELALLSFAEYSGSPLHRDLCDSLCALGDQKLLIAKIAKEKAAKTAKKIDTCLYLRSSLVCFPYVSSLTTLSVPSV